MPTKSIAWTTGSGNITLTYQGQGDGSIQVDSDANTLGTARSQIITVKTEQGGVVTKNLTVRQEACPFPVGDVRNYAYTGSCQEVVLPAGQYKLQVWGAQGGSNAADVGYGITAQPGGKGGYSEGVLTLSQKTTVRIYVGGQGSSSVGGFNGGGSTTGSSSYNSNGELGVSRMGGGGGATDIRLSDGSLNSRLIVAGGGAGGAMAYKEVTLPSTTTQDIWPSFASQWELGTISNLDGSKIFSSTRARTENYIDISGAEIINYALTGDNNNEFTGIEIDYYDSNYGYLGYDGWLTGSGSKIPKNGAKYIMLVLRTDTTYPPGSRACQAATLTMSYTIYSTATKTEYMVGGYGGGIAGDAQWEVYKGKQNAFGNGGSFGAGFNQTYSNKRYCSAGGGGGWYGGGGNWSNDYLSLVKAAGGGSGWINVAASAINRPSGYTGLELDSGSTTAGNQSFEAPGGGTETGHEGNGYARITRLA